MFREIVLLFSAIGVAVLLSALVLLCVRSGRRLKAVETQLNQIVGAVSAPLLVVDVERHILRANPAAEALLGRQENALREQPLSLFVSAAIPAEESLSGPNAATTPPPAHTGQASVSLAKAKACTIHPPNGEAAPAWIVETPVQEQDTDRSAHLGAEIGAVLLIELRQPQRTEEWISIHTLGNLMSHLPGMVYRSKHDNEWTLTFASEGTLAVTGYDAEELVNNRDRSFISLVHADDIPRVQQAVVDALEKRQAFDVVYRIRKKDGTWCWVSERGVGVFDHDQVLRTEGFISNVAERTKTFQQLERRLADHSAELNRANERLSELDRVKNKLIADISHELRSPITNLKLYMRLMQSGDGRKRPHYLEVISDEIDRLAQLVEEVLTLSRLELGADRVRFKQIDLNQIARQSVDLVRNQIEGNDLSLQEDYAGVSPTVSGDATQLSQVVINLLTNAIQYTESGGIKLETGIEDQTAYIAVHDTGPGIPADEHESIFSRFYRGRGVAQSSLAGTGLGLAVVKEIVDLHGGTIQLESTVGEGSSFRVLLPLFQAPPSLTPAGAEPDRAAL